MNQILKVDFKGSLTVKADRPLFWFFKSPILQAGDIVLNHILVHLKVEVLVLASIADVPIELGRQTVPLKSQEGFFWRLWRVKTGHPLTGVQTVEQGPARVPVAGHPPLVVVPSRLGVQELPCQAALITKTRAVIPIPLQTPQLLFWPSVKLIQALI